jgi:hypothetical protein
MTSEPMNQIMPWRKDLSSQSRIGAALVFADHLAKPFEQHVDDHGDTAA